MKVLTFLVVIILIGCQAKQSAETNEVISDAVDSETVDGLLESELRYAPFYSLAKVEANEVPADTSQILEFAVKGAYVVYPDTAWINKMQREDEDAYNTILDDNVYYNSLATDTLESRGIDTSGGGIVERRYYKFKTANGDFVADMDKIRGAWGFILYNGSDIPTMCASTYVAEIMDSVFRPADR
jgi:hypothetical protein